MDRRFAFLIPLAVAVAGVAVPLVLLAPLGGESGPPRAGPSPGPSPSSTSEPFVPPTYSEGENEVMPVVFPDGTTAEVVYPSELDLGSMRVAPNTQASLPHGDCGDDLFISREPLAAGVSGSEPVAVYEGMDGPVELWRGDPDHGGYWLIFTFGGWRVAAPCHKGPGPGEEDHAVWARSLGGTETADGYLVLRAEPPLELHPYRDVGGPAIYISEREVFVELVAGSQNDAQDRDPRDGVVQWRFQEGHIRVYGNAFSKEGEAFLATLVEGLSVRNVVPG
jgi:hypothetical protein